MARRNDSDSRVWEVFASSNRNVNNRAKNILDAPESQKPSGYYISSIRYNDAGQGKKRQKKTDVRVIPLIHGPTTHCWHQGRAQKHIGFDSLDTTFKASNDVMVHRF